ncbi:hypothetical protein TNCV_1685941 [Trichonephila clavipes]|nr:hypothetical protein TNCV_1685941 [Trichonephila clavipes]
MPSCHSLHDLELDVQHLWAHLPQDNISRLGGVVSLLLAMHACGEVQQRSLGFHDAENLQRPCRALGTIKILHAVLNSQSSCVLRALGRKLCIKITYHTKQRYQLPENALGLQ